MFTADASPIPEHAAAGAQCGDRRELRLDVINAAADYISSGGHGFALIAATAILGDAFASAAAHPWR